MMEPMILYQKTKLLHCRLKTHHWGLCLFVVVFLQFVSFFFQEDKIQLSEKNFGTPT